jgi:hypothetical protein
MMMREAEARVKRGAALPPSRSQRAWLLWRCAFARRRRAFITAALPPLPRSQTPAEHPCRPSMPASRDAGCVRAKHSCEPTKGAGVAALSLLHAARGCALNIQPSRAAARLLSVCRLLPPSAAAGALWRKSTLQHLPRPQLQHARCTPSLDRLSPSATQLQSGVFGARRRGVADALGCCRALKRERHLACTLLPCQPSIIHRRSAAIPAARRTPACCLAPRRGRCILRSAAPRRSRQLETAHRSQRSAHRCRRSIRGRLSRRAPSETLKDRRLG